MTWYNKYTGFKFKHLGDNPKTGIDCFNLCRYVYKQEKNIDIKLGTYDFCNIADDDWFQKTNKQLMLDSTEIKVEGFNWVQVSHPKSFDIILLTIGDTNITNHCGLYVGNNKLLQITMGKPSWVAPYGNYYKQYTTGIYRWNSTLN